MSVRIFRSRRVVCEATLPLPMSAITAWGQLRDFQTSAAHDPFHSGFQIEGGIPRPGAALLIEHRYLFRTIRQGRIVWWKEGEGYSFSDMSLNDVRKGFPHVFSLRVLPLDAKTCRLIIRVTGRWTMRTPRWIAWLWLTWVFGHIVAKTRNKLLHFALARQRAARNPGCGHAGRS